MISTITLIQQRILHFFELKKVKLTSLRNLIAKLKKFAEQFVNKNNVKETKMKMIWLSSFDDEDDVVKVDEDEKILRKFKKTKNFNELSAAVKEKNDYENTKYESDEKKAQDENKRMKNLIVLND